MKTTLRTYPLRAFTMVELMVSISIFMLLLIGVVQINLFGLRYDWIVSSKVGASNQSRIALTKLTSEIRSAKRFQVGSAGTFSSFTAIPDGQTNQGSALEIYPTTATNTYVRYYFDTAKKELRRRASNENSYDVIAQDLTNSMIFRAEDHMGAVLTESSQSYVMHVTLQFYQYRYPITPVGQPGSYYDYYKLEFKVTRRTFD